MARRAVRMELVPANQTHYWQTAWADAQALMRHRVVVGIVALLIAAASEFTSFPNHLHGAAKFFLVLVAAGLGAYVGMWSVAFVSMLLLAPHRQRSHARAELQRLTTRQERLSVEDFSLALDDLIRECFALIDDFSRPLAERYPDHSYPMFPSAENIDLLVDLHGRAQALLRANRPSLLHPFADAANAAMGKERDKLPGEENEEGSDAEKMQRFLEMSHGRLRIWAIGVAAGLAEARNQLGHK